MRTITAILLVTTLASANATSLRLQKRAVEVTSATAYLALLEITGLEKAFIEKTSTKYECPQALSLVQSLESMVEKNTIEMTALRTKCNATQESLEEELQAAFTKFIKKKELATMGKTTAGKKATEEEKTASPNAVFNAAVQEYDQNFKTIKDSAQKLIDGAQVELDKANLDQSAEKEKFDLAVKDFEGIKARIKSTKEESAKVTQASIDGINARLEENRKRVEDDLVVEKKSAEEAHIASSSVCSSTYSDHMILVNNDEQTLNEIKPLLANLGKVVERRLINAGGNECCFFTKSQPNTNFFVFVFSCCFFPTLRLTTVFPECCLILLLSLFCFVFSNYDLAFP